MNGRRLVALLVLAGVLILVGVWVARTVDLMPEQASNRAVLVDGLFSALLGVGTVILLIVEGGLVYAIIRFRRHPGDESDGPAMHGDARLELIWTLIPALIVIAISVASFRVLAAGDRPGDDPLIVEVQGIQFAWRFSYPEAGVNSDVLHLPVDRPVLFRITSDDVIHSFFVPEFRVKQDATPGRIAEIAVTPIRTGRFPIRCAELCGPGHATMTSEVIVERAEDFDAWLAGETAASDRDPEAQGRALFSSYGCFGCHALTDAGSSGVVGPPLDGISNWAAARVAGLDPASYLRQSILDPGAYVVAGYPDGVMPGDFGTRMSEDDLRTLVEYLSAR